MPYGICRAEIVKADYRRLLGSNSMQYKQIQVVPDKPLYVRVYEDNSIIVGVDWHHSWCWILSLSRGGFDPVTGATQLLIEDFVYHDAMPNLDIDYMDVMAAISAAHKIFFF
jgi:hypothetical protein